MAASPRHVFSNGGTCIRTPPHPTSFRSNGLSAGKVCSLFPALLVVLIRRDTRSSPNPLARVINRVCQHQDAPALFSATRLAQANSTANSQSSLD